MKEAAAGCKRKLPGQPLVMDGLRSDGKFTAKAASAVEEAEEYY